jgi:IstB-like ATP binding protein
MPHRRLGTGKSQLLIALGTEAAMAGFRVKYTLAAKLVNELVEAADELTLTKTIARYGRVDLVKPGIEDNTMTACRPNTATRPSRPDQTPNCATAPSWRSPRWARRSIATSSTSCAGSWVIPTSFLRGRTNAFHREMTTGPARGTISDQAI